MPTKTIKKEVKKEKTPSHNPLLVSVFDIKGEKIEDMELPKAIFGEKLNKALLSQAVRVFLANQRGLGAETKTRAEVAGGGAKPWRQKGTGRARAGSIRSPLWRGGGITHGPHKRDFSLDLPKKMKQAALRNALSAKAAAKEVTVLNKLELKEQKTKLAAEVIKKLALKEKVFVVVEETKALKKAFKNLPEVELVDFKNLNTYEVLNHKNLIFTKNALLEMEKFYNHGN
ncbi:MAG: 50S ribosomal protein L4 [bacterium]|nr:50S ribosomal protein L4 [bacterium]